VLAPLTCRTDTDNVYPGWLHTQNETYYRDRLKRLLPTIPESGRAISAPIPTKPEDATWPLAVDARRRTTNLESCLQAVEGQPSKGR
jgi:hypothetical protein